MSKMRCQACGAATGVGATFCQMCGQVTAAFPGGKCPNCGERIGVGAGFCHACGEPVGAEVLKARKRRITDPVKIFGLAVGVLAAMAIAQLPKLIDPWLNAFANSLGWFPENGPLAPQLQPVITFTWWLFLSLFVVINIYQLAWAGIGYAGRKRAWQKAPPDYPKPSVAVLVPVHNEEEFLDRTLESLVNQTYPNITQIIVLDDGSTDRTAAIAKEWVARDGRMTYYYQPNQGKPAALNNGFQKSNADLTFFMDGDSYLDVRCIERIVPHFLDRRVGAVASLIAIHNNKTLLAKFQELEYFFSQLVTRFCQSLEKTVIICPGAGTMVRTGIATAIRHSDRTITEDADFTFEIGRNWKISQEPDAVSYTDAMVTRKSFNNQRVRWLYGVLQTVFLHRESEAVGKLWILWAWFGYLMTPVVAAIIVLWPFMVYTFGLHFIPFLVGYAAAAGAIIWAFYAVPLLWHPLPSKKLILMIPLFLLYQQYLNFIQLSCTFRKFLGLGVTVNYGPRNIHTI